MSSSNTPALFDTHCHLSWKEKGDSAEQLWNEARQANVLEMVTIGINLEDSMRARAIAQSLKGVYATVGIHPNDLGERSALPALLDELSSTVALGGWHGIGESGLDFYRDWCDQETQRIGLRHHLECAANEGLAIVLHCREAGAELLEELRNFSRPFQGVMHCWGDDLNRLDAFLELGLSISFAGNLTYPKATDIREAAKRVPLDRLLIETDAPFLAPQAVRGKRNRPAWVRHTFNAIAELRNLDADSLAAQLVANSRRLFGIRDEPNQ